jgi:serine/threonine-protein phosphatase 2B regulatory subunit
MDQVPSSQREMTNDTGQLDRDEFLSIPQIANNPLASRMIAIFDEDGSGTVDFQEFIAGLSAFSSKGNKEEKLRCIISCALTGLTR